ncbi:MAG: ATP-binding cassette domain-containing protein [Acidimicrobiales bacterium]
MSVLVTSTSPPGGRPSAAASGASAVEVRGLTKSFGDLTAVKGVSFDVAQGEIFAFLGPNGAGKSTTIKMLCTLARPTAGSARVAGFDVVEDAKRVRRHIGLVFQEQTLDDQLTAEENLRFHAVLYGVPSDQVDARITRVFELVALSDRRKDLVSTYSGGMARRLEIARGMLHTPRVLFLDEPTVGLDPQTRALIWEDIHRLRREEGRRMPSASPSSTTARSSLWTRPTPSRPPWAATPSRWRRPTTTPRSPACALPATRSSEPRAG